jgi:hypothetical protein
MVERYTIEKAALIIELDGKLHQVVLDENITNMMVNYVTGLCNGTLKVLPSLVSITMAEDA